MAHTRASATGRPASPGWFRRPSEEGERRGYIERGQALYTQLVNTLREQITSGPHIRTNDQGEDDRHV
jgi:hypothetical protein